MNIPGGAAIMRRPDHTYGLLDPDGEPLAGWWPGVTSILGVIARPALVRWVRTRTAAIAVREREALAALAAQGGTEQAVRWLAGSTERLSAHSAERGTEVHAIAERLARGGDPGPIAEPLAPYVAAWTAWRDSFRPRFLVTEAPVLSPDACYGGTADAFIADAHGEVWVVDYKTRSSAEAATVYDHEPLQLAGLAAAELAADRLGGIARRLPRVEHGAVLLLRPDGSYRFVPVAIGPIQRGAFAHLRAVAAYLANDATSTLGAATDSQLPPPGGLLHPGR